MKTMRELIEGMRGISPEAEGMVRKGDILLAQGLGYLWKAADAFTLAGNKKIAKEVAMAVNSVASFLRNSDPDYEKEIMKIARKVEKR